LASKPNSRDPAQVERPDVLALKPEIAPDCAGLNFFDIDHSLRDLLPLYLEREEQEILTPHMRRLGELAGGRLDELARTADRHPPVLHARDRFGVDEDFIEYHPAYREMEQIAFGDFQFHAMGHRAGAFGMTRPVSPRAKYVFQYLFVQAEFGLMCPISVTDTSTHLVRKFADDQLKDLLLPRMLSVDMSTLWKGTQFMTEQTGGSDVGTITTTARKDGNAWRLSGDKWFCSHTDADVALLLARPEGAPTGTRGLALFAMPRQLEDGSRNSYRIVRLKDKLGTRSMASGEIRMDGAFAWLVGDETQGLKQMLEQVNLSRLSHGVRAAAMMRRCVNEALVCARSRRAFGETIIDFPLLRRQLAKLIVPAEQSLSVMMAAAEALDQSNSGSDEAKSLLRILTPLLKFRACRDNVTVATGAMEVRGGNGYIEEWVNARLVRDAHIGVLWEGTSNINALDIITRAVGRERAHRTLATALHRRLDALTKLPDEFLSRIRQALDGAVHFAEQVAASAADEASARQAASALYHATSAVLMAWESCGSASGGRRALLARFVLERRLSPHDPFKLDAPFERDAIGLLLEDRPLTLAEVAPRLTG
jgi:alkylation response protein AidB-like acyl-CoA dehydrogenase